MLIKLLKHEFRATGRIMLLIYAAVAALTVLANVSIRLMDVTNSTVLHILFGLIIGCFFMGIAAAAAITAVLMIGRFYRSLLGGQGYLMHTLPVTVHHHIWSKLLVSLVWFAATFLLTWLVILITVLIQSGTDLGALFAELPSWSELQRMLAAAGLRASTVTALAFEIFALVIVCCLVTCLHFYAAMTLGHMFSRSRVLLSVVFFIAISVLFSILGTGLGRVTDVFASQDLTTSAAFYPALRRALGIVLGFQLFHGAVLYIATALGLKRGLNLA